MTFRPKLVHVLAVVLGLSSWATAGHFATITIDGDTADWAGVPSVDSDPADNVASVDLADTYIANDNDFLYVRNTYHGALSLGTFIALDVDSDLSTGFDVFGLGLIGSEAGWQNDFPFTQAAGVFNDGVGMSGDFFGSGAALLTPFADVSDRELAISLDVMFNSDGSDVFANSTFDLLIWTDLAAGDVSQTITYTLAVPEPTDFVCLLLIGAIGLLRRR